MITSRNNPEILEVIKLKQKKNREELDSFIIEGIKLLDEAIKSGIFIQKIYLLPEFSSQYSNKGIEIEEISKPVLEKLSSVKSPEGVVAVAKKSTISIPDKNYYLLLDTINDPGNLGTIIRTADAAGFSKIYLSNNTVDIYNEKVLRSSMGSTFHIPIEQNVNLIELVEELKSQDFEVISTSLNGEDIYLNKVQQPKKLALILGNESHGINKELQQLSTKLIRLPIFGKAESLNVAVAAGIFMYAFTDQCEK